MSGKAQRRPASSSFHGPPPRITSATPVMWKTQSGGKTESAADTSPRFRLSIQMRWYSITDSTGMLDLVAGFLSIARLDQRLYLPTALSIPYVRCNDISSTQHCRRARRSEERRV